MSSRNSSRRNGRIASIRKSVEKTVRSSMKRISKGYKMNAGDDAKSRMNEMFDANWLAMEVRARKFRGVSLKSLNEFVKRLRENKEPMARGLEIYVFQEAYRVRSRNHQMYVKKGATCVLSRRMPNRDKLEVYVPSLDDVIIVEEQFVSRKECSQWTLEDVVEFVFKRMSLETMGVFFDGFNRVITKDEAEYQEEVASAPQGSLDDNIFTLDMLFIFPQASLGQPFQGTYVICPYNASFFELMETLTEFYGAKKQAERYIYLDIFQSLGNQPKTDFVMGTKSILEAKVQTALGGFKECVFFSPSLKETSVINMLCDLEIITKLYGVVTKSADLFQGETHLIYPRKEEEFHVLVDRLATGMGLDLYGENLSRLELWETFSPLGDQATEEIHSAISERLADGFHEVKKSIILFFFEWIQREIQTRLKDKGLLDNPNKKKNQKHLQLQERLDVNPDLLLVGGRMMLYSFQYESAEYLLRLARASSVVEKDRIKLARNLHDHAFVLMRLGEYPSALKKAKDSLALAQAIQQQPRGNGNGSEDVRSRPIFMVVVADTIALMASIYLAMEEFDIATQMSQDALKICQDLFGQLNSNKPTLQRIFATCMLTLGTIQKIHNQFDEALEQFERSLGAMSFDQQQLFMKEHEQLVYVEIAHVAILSGNPGYALKVLSTNETEDTDSGDSEWNGFAKMLMHYMSGIAQKALNSETRAIIQFDRCVQIGQELFPSYHSHPLNMAVEVELADLLASRGQHKEALRAQERLLGRRKDKFGLESLAVADSLFRIAKIRLDMGSYEEAMDELAECLSIRTSMLSTKNHPIVADCLELMGMVMYSQNQHKDKIVPIIDRCIGIHEICSSHKSVIDRVKLFKSKLMAKSGSIANLQDALEIQSEVGTDKLSMAATMVQMGTVHENNGDIKQALGSYKQAHGEFKQVQDLPKAYVEIYIRCCNGISRLSSDVKKRVKFLEISLETYRKYEETKKIDNPLLLGQTLAQFGVENMEQGNLVDAATHLKEAIQILEPFGLAESCMIQLADIFNVEEDHDKAKDILTQVLNDRVQKLGEQHPLVLKTKCRLGFTLLDLHEPESAQKMFQTLLDQDTEQNVTYLYGLARSLFEQERYPDTIEILEKSLTLNRDSVECRFLMAQTLHAQGDKDGAIEQYQFIRDCKASTARQRAKALIEMEHVLHPIEQHKGSDDEEDEENDSDFFGLDIMEPDSMKHRSTRTLSKVSRRTSRSSRRASRRDLSTLPISIQSLRKKSNIFMKMRSLE